MSALKNYDYTFNALGDPTRRAIFEKLGNGPLSVLHIADGLTVTRSAVSQHLKVLKEAKLIQMETQGTRSIYSIDREGLRVIRAYLDRFWDDGLNTFKQLAEKEQSKKNKK